MKKLMLIGLATVSVNAYAQQKLAEEKIPYVEYIYKCHFCGLTYTYNAIDWKDIKNPDIDKCFGGFAKLKEIAAAGDAKRDGDRTECNGSRNGKHTYNFASKKVLTIVKVRMDGKGSCNIVD